VLKGFKDFIMKGNVIDLAVGVIIGAAFGAIVESLVGDIINPAIGAIVGAPDFSAIKAGPLMIGKFINAVIAFLLKAAALYFFLVVPYNALTAKPAPPAAAPPPTPTETFLKEIRDLLAKR
jgi:large conductance mechanosensitive channel